MTFLAKPKLHHPDLPANALGFTRRDYEGTISTLCAGCGHDSISAAIIQACWELAIEPHRVAKLSGIGCSSKTPTYFLDKSHGFNSVHGRMPSVLTGANLANRDLIYLGVSGDGDSASIGLGQFAHSMRRGVNMTYIVENNGVYGLTKGQFSATADRGSKSKRGAVNSDEGHRPRHPGAAAGRDLRGAQLLRRQGAARSPDQGRAHAPRGGLHRRDLPLRGVQQPRGLDAQLRLRAQPQRGRQLPRRDHRAQGDHDGVSARSGAGRCASTTARVLRLRKLAEDYDSSSRIAAMSHVQSRYAQGEIVTGLLYIEADATDLHESLGTVDRPLNELGERELCPGFGGAGEVQCIASLGSPAPLLAAGGACRGPRRLPPEAAGDAAASAPASVAAARTRLHAAPEAVDPAAAAAAKAGVEVRVLNRVVTRFRASIFDTTPAERRREHRASPARAAARRRGRQGRGEDRARRAGRSRSTASSPS